MNISETKLSQPQEKLLEDEDILLTYLFLDTESTIKQIISYTGFTQLRVVHILNQLMKHQLVNKMDYVGDRNVQFSTYRSTEDDVDLSNIAEKNTIGATHLITKKVQRDLTQVLSHYDESFLPKVSYASYQLSERSYSEVTNKVNELFEFIKEKEKEDMSQNKDTTNVILSLSFYTNPEMKWKE
ncbi:hypothetical protein [Longirhabdus pacifica]|uniref:hypothetical protein n=1 Tax=Longirhabdus pacifica TaxID=2305227 RepID=UPI001008C148|nr:hypothetical protein [Longirhabdus pacifica]